MTGKILGGQISLAFSCKLRQYGQNLTKTTSCLKSAVQVISGGGVMTH